jgi:hypothetical protein
VIVFRNSEIGFGDKEQDESQGPVQCLCLDRIMTLLSPVEDIPGPGSAANWRAQVAAVKAERTAANRRVGDTIRLPARAHFTTTGISTDRFHRDRDPQTHRDPRTNVTYAFGCRLRPATLATASVER